MGRIGTCLARSRRSCGHRAPGDGCAVAATLAQIAVSSIVLGRCALCRCAVGAQPTQILRAPMGPWPEVSIFVLLPRALSRNPHCTCMCHLLRVRIGNAHGCVQNGSVCRGVNWRSIAGPPKSGPKDGARVGSAHKFGAAGASAISSWSWGSEVDLAPQLGADGINIFFRVQAMSAHPGPKAPEVHPRGPNLQRLSTSRCGSPPDGGALACRRRGAEAHGRGLHAAALGVSCRSGREGGGV